VDSLRHGAPPTGHACIDPKLIVGMFKRLSRLRLAEGGVVGHARIRRTLDEIKKNGIKILLVQEC
jgi:hypothetical protein